MMNQPIIEYQEMNVPLVELISPEDDPLEYINAVKDGIKKDGFVSYKAEQFDRLADNFREAYAGLSDEDKYDNQLSCGEIVEKLEGKAEAYRLYAEELAADPSNDPLSYILTAEEAASKDWLGYFSTSELGVIADKFRTAYASLEEDEKKAFEERCGNTILQIECLASGIGLSSGQKGGGVNEMELDEGDFISESGEFALTRENYINPTVVASQGSLAAQAYGSFTLREEQGSVDDGAKYFPAIDLLVEKSSLGHREIAGNNPVIDDAVKHSDVIASRRNYARKAEKVILAAAGLFTAAAIGAMSLLSYNAISQQNNDASLSYHFTPKAEAAYQSRVNKLERKDQIQTQKKPAAGLELEKKNESAPRVNKSAPNIVKSLPHTDHFIYKVKKDDTVVSKWQQYRIDGGELAWEEFLIAVKMANPHKQNLNKIWAGENLKLPSVPNSVGKERWRWANL